MNLKEIDYSLVPYHMREAAKSYVEYGSSVGNFLTAVICNDLFEAFLRADQKNQDAMRNWVCFFYNEVPSTCYGSKEKMKDWIESGGVRGIYPHLFEEEVA